MDRPIHLQDAFPFLHFVRIVLHKAEDVCLWKLSEVNDQSDSRMKTGAKIQIPEKITD